MSSNRIATYATSSAMTDQLMKLQSQYNAANVQESSGLISTTYTGIASSAQQLLNLKSGFTILTAQNANTQTAESRVNSAYDTMGSLSDLVTSMISTVSGDVSGELNTSSEMQSASAAAQQEAQSLLNTQIGGVYIFGGSNTNTAPVNIAGMAVQTSPSTADTSYYKGDDTLPSVATSKNSTVTYGATADNPAFEQMFRALNLLANNSGNKAAVEEAYSLLESASSGISDVQAQLHVQAETLDRESTVNTTALSQLTSSSSDLQNSDVSKVTVTMTNLQTQLEAAYSSLSKILSLNLASYLR